jgi:trehalose 6-phosphate phosphatase
VGTGSPIVSGEESLDAFVKAAAEAPAAAALLCDIDGTISPIAPRPADAHVPEAFRELLVRLVRRIGLVAFVTGRSLEDGRRMIPLEGAAYIGAHGLETRAPDGSIIVEPQAERYVAAIHDVAEAAARDLDCEALGVVIEDKRTVLAIHYRLAEDAAATRHQILTRVIEPARDRGLAIATGHFAFEVRPPLPFTKGSAVRRLLTAGDYFSAMGCGDDLTDITMFSALREWGERDARRAALAVAAVTDETPRPVAEAADVLVRATPGVHEVLARLAAAVGEA